MAVTEKHEPTEMLGGAHLGQLLEQSPGFVAILRGPEHVYEFTNPAYRRLIGDRDFIGKSVRDVVPDADGQGFFELLDRVYATGAAHLGKRQHLVVQPQPGRPKDMYLDFVYQPLRGSDGTVCGIFVEGVEVTADVRIEAHLRLLNNELKHRVKNLLAVVSAIASQTLRGQTSEAAMKAFQDRLGVLAKAHDLLTATTSGTSPIRDVIESAIAPHNDGKGRVSISGPPVTLGPDQAVALALAVHELGTNAIKYGALSNDRGQVDVVWRKRSDDGRETFSLTWQEVGGPPVAKPSKQGFGSKLIGRLLTAEFGGHVEVFYEPSGFACHLTAPIENLDPSRPFPVA